MHEIIGYIALALAGIVLIVLLSFVLILIQMKLTKQTTVLSNKAACRKVKREIFIRNWTDFFWSNSMRFAWITLGLFTIITYSYVMYVKFHVTIGVFISILFSFITIAFFYFSRKSYYAFEAKAKAKLTEFENAIKAGIEKEISFEGDPIQIFAKESENISTDEVVFYFPVGTKKIAYPLFQSNPKKQPIISERKLEALILSREYFSICQLATPFNLLAPKLGGVPKKCAPVKASGECVERYYSQMRNVLYKDDAIQIIFENGDDNVVFKCPKAAPNRKPAMKALKEKLRITERQRMAKMQEQKWYEDLKNKEKEDPNIEDDGEEIEVSENKE